MYKMKEVKSTECFIYRRHPFALFDSVHVKANPLHRCINCGSGAKFHYGKWFHGEEPCVYTEPFCSEKCYKKFYTRRIR